MRQKRETPEPWASAMENAGIDSLRELARRADVSVAAVTRLVHGDPGKPSARVIKAVARQFTRKDALQVPLWAGLAWRSNPKMPDTAYELTPKQWGAIEQLIEAIVSPGEAAAFEPSASIEGVHEDEDEQDYPAAASGRTKSTTKRIERGGD